MAVEIVGLGVDVCEIDRMERALAHHTTMRERVFTPEERAYCEHVERLGGFERSVALPW